MTRPSGWCSPAFGTVHSPAAHDECSRRVKAGLLAGCGCEMHEEED